MHAAWELSRCLVAQPGSRHAWWGWHLQRLLHEGRGQHAPQDEAHLERGQGLEPSSLNCPFPQGPQRNEAAHQAIMLEGHAASAQTWHLTIRAGAKACCWR